MGPMMPMGRTRWQRMSDIIFGHLTEKRDYAPDLPAARRASTSARFS